MSEILMTETFRKTCCCHTGCHMVFAVPVSVYNDWQKTGEWFYCPNGHHQHFSETTEQRLRRQLLEKEGALARSQQAVDTNYKRARIAERGAAIVKGKHRALKQRVAAGLCPCCRRPFANLMAHMQHQHPAFRPKGDS